MIDNAIDLWTKNKNRDLEIKVTLEVRHQLISIEDNSGGIQEGKLDHIISPGKTTNDVSVEIMQDEITKLCLGLTTIAILNQWVI